MLSFSKIHVLLPNANYCCCNCNQACWRPLRCCCYASTTCCPAKYVHCPDCCRISTDSFEHMLSFQIGPYFLEQSFLSTPLPSPPPPRGLFLHCAWQSCDASCFSSCACQLQLTTNAYIRHANAGTPWTKNEVAILKELSCENQKPDGSIKWAAVASHLPGRTDSEVARQYWRLNG